MGGADTTCALLGSGGPLVCFFLPGCFSCKNIYAQKILDQFEFPKIPEMSKYAKLGFLFCRVITKIRGIDGKSP
jgi:hypothetical protein